MKMYVVGDWVKVTEGSFMPFRGKWVKIVEINYCSPTMPICKIEYNGERHLLPTGDVVDHMPGQTYKTNYRYYSPFTFSNNSVVTYDKTSHEELLKTRYLADWRADRTYNVAKKEENNMPVFPGIKNVYFNDPVTVVIWADKSKTIVRCSENDFYDPEKGLAMAIIKKMMGNDNTYHKIFKKWVPESEPIDEETWAALMKTLEWAFSCNKKNDISEPESAEEVTDTEEIKED